VVGVSGLVINFDYVCQVKAAFGWFTFCFLRHIEAGLRSLGEAT